MKPRDVTSWLWSVALSQMEQAERLHRQFCRIGATSAQCWEPPVDILESEEAVFLHAALPGVPASAVTLSLDSAGIT